MTLKENNMISKGDIVTVSCLTSIGTSEQKIVTDITTKYDSDTGKPYPIIHIGDHMFDGRDLNAVNSPTMYYIEK